MEPLATSPVHPAAQAPSLDRAPAEEKAEAEEAEAEAAEGEAAEAVGVGRLR